MIKIRNLYKKIGDKTILKNINLDLEAGKTTVIIGPSGSGKSTLLRCINLLEHPTSGNIFIDDIDIIDEKTNKDTLRQKVGMVFQHFNLFNNLDAISNMVLAMQKVQNVKKYSSFKIAIKLLEKVNLKNKVRNFPHTLSGGEKQRLAIARALALKPEYLLFDEPTSALDPEMVKEVLVVIKDLSKSITSIIVSHEMNFVKNIADNIVFMEGGEIIKIAEKKEFFENSNDRINNFLGKLGCFN